MIGLAAAGVAVLWWLLAGGTARLHVLNGAGADAAAADAIELIVAEGLPLAADMVDAGADVAVLVYVEAQVLDGFAATGNALKRFQVALGPIVADGVDAVSEVFATELTVAIGGRRVVDLPEVALRGMDSGGGGMS